MTTFRSGIETFLEFWQQKPNSPEGKIAGAYKGALDDFERQQTGLLRYIRPQKTNGKLIPVFAEGSDGLISGFESAEKHLADIQTDISDYLAFTEGQPSMSGLNDRLMRARHAIAEASIEAKSALARAVRETDALSQLQVMDNQAVQSAMDNRDRIQSQLGPIVEDIQGRIAKIKEIINKYNRIEI